jgi:uncharacterized protein (DUF2267 family)
MTHASQHMFDVTVRTADRWVYDVGAEMDEGDPHRAYLALRAVLHAVRDRLPVMAAAAFGCELPTLVRGCYYENWCPADTPVRDPDQDIFLMDVGRELRMAPGADPEAAARAVFRVVAELVPGDAVESVKRGLPAPVRDLWS